MPIEKAKVKFNPGMKGRKMTPTSGPAEKLFSISQVNAITGVPKSTIRFWEKEFQEFLAPLRTDGNQRRYDERTVDIIKKIDHLVNTDGFTLDGARRQLNGQMSRTKSPPDSQDRRLDELAETMSDYLLQKLFERVREEESRN